MSDKPFISELLAFEQNLTALASIANSATARSQLQGTIEKFVLDLKPENMNKARRFQALCSLECFDANFEMRMPAEREIPLAGLPTRFQRPVEYALGQFLMSGASSFWRSALMHMAINPRFEGALQRPLPFAKLEIEEQPGAPTPIVKCANFPAFAHTFLIQESLNFPEPTARAIQEMAKALELRMAPESRELAGEEKFLLAAFGQIVSTKAAKAMSMSLARGPIAVKISR